MAVPYRPRVRWVDQPPVETTFKPDLLSPKAGQVLDLVILSERVRLVETHYLAERTTPCIGDEGTCNGCKCGLQCRLKGYLAVWIPRLGPAAIAELTTEAWRRCAAFHQPGFSLRGRALKLSRPGTKKNGRVRADVGELVRGADALSAGFDLDCALYRIWFAPARDKRGPSGPRGDDQPVEGHASL